jgi:UDP-2,3-diacylglucosamine pyrophosphatase LpxH
MFSPHRRTEMLGRSSECKSLDRLLEDVRGGRSRVLVLHGDAGVRKTAHREYLVATTHHDRNNAELLQFLRTSPTPRARDRMTASVAG